MPAPSSIDTAFGSSARWSEAQYRVKVTASGELLFTSARCGAGSCTSPAPKRAILTGPTGFLVASANSSWGEARCRAIGVNPAPAFQPRKSEGSAM